MSTSKNLTVHLLCYALILLVFPLQAQIPTTVDQHNYQEAATSIAHTFGDILQVDEHDIQAFFQNLVQDAVPNLDAPNASVKNSTANMVRFQWQPVAQAQRYHIAYLNLKQANSGHQTYLPSTDNTYKLAGIPDDLYLYAFQTIAPGNLKSKVNIIIHDKDIFLTTNPNIDCNCLAPGDYEAFEGNLPLGGFELSIQDQGEPVVSIPGFKDQFGVAFNFTCPGPQASIFQNNIYYLDPGFGPELGVITISLDYNLPEDYQVLFRTCNTDDPDRNQVSIREDEGININSIHPNPFKDQLQIEYQLSKASHIFVELRNASGQLLQTKQYGFQEAGQYTQTIDASHLPNGLYFGLLYIDETLKKFPLIKQE
jgi:hypothetical protein